MALISIREYARRKGLTHQAILKRVRSGRISLVDGKIDPARADAEWDEKRDVLQQQRGAKHSRGAECHEDVPDIDDHNSKPPEAKNRSLAEAQRLDAWIKVNERKLRFEQLKKTLVDAEKVRAEVEARFRNDAEALLNWPARISADLAAELGTDERLTHAALEKYVRQFMRERSMVPVSVGAD